MMHGQVRFKSTPLPLLIVNRHRRVSCLWAVRRRRIEMSEFVEEEKHMSAEQGSAVVAGSSFALGSRCRDVEVQRCQV
jgi:hypothetical protein